MRHIDPNEQQPSSTITSCECSVTSTKLAASFRSVARRRSRGLAKPARARWPNSSSPRSYRTISASTMKPHANAALADPDGFAIALPRPAAIDEVQRAPDLMLAIKQILDNDQAPGQFLLTGSADTDIGHVTNYHQGVSTTAARFANRPHSGGRAFSQGVEFDVAITTRGAVDLIKSGVAGSRVRALEAGRPSMR